MSIIFPDKFLLKNKIAVVTGGFGLIGTSIVDGLFQAGAIVYIADLIQKETESGKWIPLDISDSNSIKSCIKTIISNEGKIDIWINCAFPRTEDWSTKFEDVKEESLKKNIDMHLNGYILCCQEITKQMKKQRNGVIINFGSIYGVVGPDFSIYDGTDMTMPMAYAAIKGGIINFTRYLATYYAKYGIRVNAICPGGIYDKQPISFVKKYSKRTPMGRMGNPDEIAGPIIFLSSDASSYITGHILMVDGGWTAW
ncbi:MAG: SDR family oxidoreductase [Actinobacteria bacterium]|nr:SDR family oxidoreductase [Actinomycetota bacterium]MBE3114633.1 SDR family oxidoreductase [Actinomycetota bacterium]